MSYSYALAAIFFLNLVVGTLNFNFFGIFFARNYLIQQLALTFLNELQYSSLDNNLYIESLSNTLCLHLLRHYNILPTTVANNYDGLPGFLLRRLVEYIQANLAQNLTLVDMAQVVNLSTSHLNRLFKQIQARFSKIKYGLLTLILVVILLFSFNLPAIAANSTTSTEQNRAIAMRFAQEGWGTNLNWEKAWDELVSPNLIYHFNSAAQPIVGLEANKEFNKSLFQGFPNIRQKIEDVIVEGDKVVYRTTLQGTNTGEFLGTPPTGKSVKVNDFTLLQIADGQIAEMWYECNLLEVMQQMGLIPRAN
jgi:predicted ester cyclase